VLEALVPPNSEEAERAVLGAVLIDSSLLGDLVEVLSVHDLYREPHRHIFEAMLKLYARGGAIDVVTLMEELKGRGAWESITHQAAYLAELTENTIANKHHLLHYAQIVREKALLREIGATAQQVLMDTRQPVLNVEDFVHQTEQAFYSITDRRSRSTFANIEDLTSSALAQIKERQEQGGNLITGVGTGFIELDKMTSGLQQGDLIILAARPSMGKSALAMNIATHAAAAGVGVGFFSLEMTQGSLITRILSGQADLDLLNVKNGLISDSDYARLLEVADRLVKWPLVIDDSPGLSTAILRGKVRRLAARTKMSLGLIVVDYLGLMKAADAKQSREQQVSEFSASLKAIAREFSLPVLALSQLNRQCEMRENKRPLLGDLRDSGSLEQDADLVLMLYRDEHYTRDRCERPGEAELIISKQRNGPTGLIQLQYSKASTTFHNLSDRMEEI